MTTPAYYQVSKTQGRSEYGRDFKLSFNYEICGRVFEDFDQNGVQLNSSWWRTAYYEGPLSWVATVELWEKGGNAPLQTTGHGEYCFRGLTQGDYTVRINVPDHYKLTSLSSVYNVHLSASSSIAPRVNFGLVEVEEADSFHVSLLGRSDARGLSGKIELYTISRGRCTTSNPSMRFITTGNSTGKEYTFSTLPYNYSTFCVKAPQIPGHVLLRSEFKWIRRGIRGQQYHVKFEYLIGGTVAGTMSSRDATGFTITLVGLYSYLRGTQLRHHIANS